MKILLLLQAKRNPNWHFINLIKKNITPTHFKNNGYARFKPR